METDRGGNASSTAQLMDALFGGHLGHGLSVAQKAAQAWYAANGDRERAHTTGVWLRKSGRAGVDPVLVVALDSNLLAGELGTNKDLYLSRLSFHGVHVSDIRFTVGQRNPQTGSQGTARGARRRHVVPGTEDARQNPSPELSPDEEQRVARATAGLPEGLRQSVSRAMCASLRRNKAKTT